MFCGLCVGLFGMLFFILLGVYLGCFVLGVWFVFWLFLGFVVRYGSFW